MLLTGNVPLMLDPSHSYDNRYGKYEGPPIPICTRVNGRGVHRYVCKYPVKMNGDGLLLRCCSFVVECRQDLNITYMHFHAKEKHWRAAGSE